MGYAELSPIPTGIMYDDLPTVARYTGLGRTAIYDAIRNKGFPDPVRFGARTVRWKRTEVLAWIESRPRGIRPSEIDRARARRQQEVSA